jgi:hypothetical protein
MRYFAKRARKKQDISLLLKVCPTCLGDLVPPSSDAGASLRCMQCKETVQPATARPSALPLPEPATLPSDFFSEQEPLLPWTRSALG